MSTPPLISIVTPVLNHREHIETCLASVAAQDYDRVEHLIVDGGSTDGTLEVIQDYARRYPGRVKYVTGRDRGPGDAWNKGVKLATGDILGCIGADDECEPGALRAVADFFAEQPQADFVHGNCRIAGPGGDERIHVALPFDYSRFVNTAIDIATPSAFYRRHVLERVGWLDECGDDFDLMLRIARAFTVHTMPRVLSTLRVYTGSAYNPHDARTRAVQLGNTYRISRRHGGSRVSRLALRYYWARLSAVLGLKPDMHFVRRISRGMARASSR